MRKMLLILLFCAGLGPSAGLARAGEVSGYPRVVDGDTLAFGAARVRLNGIDAPERHQACRDQAGSKLACGKAAAAALAGEIGSSAVVCRGEAPDRYGRLVATCWKGQEDLNGWMVRAGWAVAYRRYSTRYVAEEDAARLARRGLWGGGFAMPWDWRRARRR